MSFADPIGNIEQLGLREGMKVADLGAGIGAYAIPAGKKVGDTGRVFAVEVQKNLLTTIKDTAFEKQVSNVEVIWGDIENLNGTKIADYSVDVIIIANVLFQVEDKDGVLKEARRILKQDGRLLLVDWKDSYGGVGPQPEYIVTADKARALFETAGFVFVESIDTGSQHYGFIVSKG